MKRTLRIVGLGLLGLVGIGVVAAGALMLMGAARMERTYQAAEASLVVPADSATLAYGQHLANVNGCRDCHGENLAGTVFVDAPPFLVTASNLTPGAGGIGGTYTDADWNRAIRHGLRPDGRALLVMPSTAYHHMSDADAAALIAYLKTLEPIDQPLPPTELRPLGRLLVAVGGINPLQEVDLKPTPRAHPVPAPTADYGAYLASVTCTHCHGADLHGAQPLTPGSPLAPDLAVAAAWPFDTFVTAMRTGQRPTGADLNPQFMPWTAFQHMTDDELRALYAFLQTLPPRTTEA